MTARWTVWSDEEVVELAKKFVPCADEVHHLQTVRGAEGDLFRKVAEQGHYAGRTKPTSTRQGIYACAPSGKLLASINSNDPRAMAGMLKKALAAWEALPNEERLLEAAPEEAGRDRQRWERLYPKDGLVLKVFSRDLPREGQEERWAHAWNLDFAWFRREEAAQFVPETLEEGALREIPRPLFLRLARLHLVDNVRGQTWPFSEKEIVEGSVAAIVDSVKDGVAELRFAGKSKASAEGKWRVNGFDPTLQEQKRGYDAKWLGKATWDSKAGKFTAFELVVAGKRWGGTQYNGRPQDLGEAPMGHVLKLAGDTPAERVAPASIWSYGW